ncbi:MAG: MG2 domain-containing protein, partial [Saprospiraceae bacterium]
MTSFNDKEYAAEWKSIDSLQQKGLPKSALEKVEALLVKTRADKNPAHTIKALLYRSKYESQLEESGSSKAIVKLEQEMESADHPVDAVLASILAEAYTQYLQSNRWQIQQRTNTVSFDNEDLETWTIDQFATKSMELYRLSVSNPNLRKVDIQNFNAITSNNSNTDDLRPSLFDFLAHRAIDYFMNEQSYLSQPAFRFYLDDSAIFLPASQFSNNIFTSKDSLSGKYNALVLLQELVKRHLDDEDPSALIHADLKRLTFAKNNAIVSGKDELYYDALKEMKDKHSSHAASAEILTYMAQYHSELGYKYSTTDPEETHRFEFKKALELYEEAITKFPESYGAKIAAHQKAQIESKSLKMISELVNVPEKPFLLKLDAKNINQVYFRIAKLSPKEYNRITQVDRRKVIKELKKLKAIESWSSLWPATEDYQQHTIETRAPKLPNGSYLVMASADKNFSDSNNAFAYTFTHVSNISFWKQQQNNSGQSFVVVNRVTGKPMEDVTATFYMGKYNRKTRTQDYEKISSQVTNADGIIKPKVALQKNFKITFQKGEDLLDVNENFSDYRNNYERSKSKSTEFFFDRKIYRPGQTVYFKALALEKDKDLKPRILSNESIIITFYDANRQEVDSRRMMTNAYGTVHGTFTAPKTGLLG